MKDIGDIALKRFEAYARVQAMAKISGSNPEAVPSKVQQDLHNRAVRVNEISEEIATWFRDLYWVPDKYLKDPNAPVQEKVNQFTWFGAPDACPWNTGR